MISKTSLNVELLLKLSMSIVSVQIMRWLLHVNINWCRDKFVVIPKASTKDVLAQELGQGIPDEFKFSEEKKTSYFWWW